MSKRHQSSRRKSYGRRQHELRERVERRALPERAEGILDELSAHPAEPFTFLDPRTSRLRFALGE